MVGLLPWYALAVVTTLLNGGALGYIARRERAPALWSWAGAWTAWGLAVVPLAALGGARDRPLLAVLCGLLWVVSTLLFLRGAYALAPRRAPKVWLAVGAACAVLAVALGVGPRGAAGMIPLVLFQSVGLVATGVVIVRVEGQRAGAWLSGVALVGLGLHVLDAPVLARHPALFVWGFVVAIALQVLTAAGMLMLHYEHARAELVEAQQALEETRRIEALGRVAGGVAHDFNNMLTVMKGHLDFVGDGTSRQDLDESVAAMKDAVERAGRLTKQLLAFGRRSVLRPHGVDVREVVGGTLALLRKVIPSNIDLQFRGPDAPILASMDQTLVEQIVLNLVTNARDAISGQGRIQVELERREGPPALVVLRVTDDGQGMDEGVVRRVFEPFFTLKPAGRGTGLGLASVQGAVSQLGGEIGVRSKVGAGSTFEVTLPWIAAAPQPAEGAEPVRSKCLDILVVDDDERVREVTARILRAGGHQVVEAADGRAALELIRARTYDLLISDVVMPRMGGGELATEARRLRPEMSLLLASGYPASGVPDSERVSFLAKPYGPNELLAHVARVSGSARASVRGAVPQPERPRER